MTLAEDDIPVIVELDHEHVRMSAAGTEIGHWATDECRISHVGETTYSITAEDETIQFVPNQPGLFAAAINGGGDVAAVAMPSEQAPEHADGRNEAPPAKPLTMGLFYALSVTTGALGLWSLISIIF